MITHLSQIISRNPGFMVKWALPVFVFIFIMIVAATSMVRYPEIVKTNALLIDTVAGNRYYAEIDIPHQDAGKIAAGQQVQLRFHGYSNSEFGYVSGTVKQVSKLAPGLFKAWIALPASLITSTQKTIPYRSGLKADAIIIVKDMRLIQRIFKQSTKTISISIYLYH